ncbi:hypothetical protein [Roseateles agri]
MCSCIPAGLGQNSITFSNVIFVFDPRAGQWTSLVQAVQGFRAIA